MKKEVTKFNGWGLLKMKII